MPGGSGRVRSRRPSGGGAVVDGLPVTSVLVAVRGPFVTAWAELWSGMGRDAL
jgi:hypothetical protein